MEQTQLWSSSGKELTKYLRGDGTPPSHQSLPSKCMVPHATLIIFTKDIPFELVSCLLNCFYQANFVTGAQIQLVSKASGHTLHIVQAPSGELLVEGKGEIGPEAWNGRPYRSH